MVDKPEERARAEIDRLLAAAGWSVQFMFVRHWPTDGDHVRVDDVREGVLHSRTASGAF